MKITNHSVFYITNGYAVVILEAPLFPPMDNHLRVYDTVSSKEGCVVNSFQTNLKHLRVKSIGVFG